MTDELDAKDYPIAQTRPERVLGRRGKPLDSLTLDAVIDGDVEMEDLRITPQALLQQAQIAKSVGRAALAGNLERAAEMTEIPQAEVMRIYELLRPGRSASSDELRDAAHQIRSRYNATLLADFIEEAAAFYDKRGLFRKRY
ncbi:diol dehydratase small subunit [Sedimentitalea todarodis]|uniref:Diol dehydratase small subunit n=1 Tax=Sedimentitalea todarodis TaxID=1631240 RepID=A0ABU3V8V0_9RHOB|nr:diol dehydratase small subunit [Sedimentitalea todarodis]MDU9002595.1 diol dehydratase small subunit [Sedimentitalea todarodis]